MTFRTHLAITFTFVRIALHTLNWLLKRPNYSHTLLTHYLLLPPKSVFSNSTDPDAAFVQGIYCMLRQIRSSVKEIRDSFLRKYKLWPLSIYNWPLFLY